MKRNAIVLFCICFILMFFNSNSDTVNTSLYEGRSLVIGLIGDPPIIREEHVDFKEITLKQLADQELPSDLDAIFIMKEHLVEASDQKYVKVYQNADIPFFYIDSKKSYIPFTNEELSYDEVPDLSADTYATGYYGKKSRTWGYGLYNDVLNEANIMDVYSRIFTTIESL